MEYWSQVYARNGVSSHASWKCKFRDFSPEPFLCVSPPWLESLQQGAGNLHEHQASGWTLWTFQSIHRPSGLQQLPHSMQNTATLLSAPGRCSPLPGDVLMRATSLGRCDGTSSFSITIQWIWWVSLFFKKVRESKTRVVWRNSPLESQRRDGKQQMLLPKLELQSFFYPALQTLWKCLRKWRSVKDSKSL